MLTIAVSSRSLFHIEDGNEIFINEGQEAFNEYMRSKENIPLRPGVAFPLIKKLLDLNKRKSPDPHDKVDVVLLSRNSFDAGLRIMNSIEHYKLDIEKASFTQGDNRFKYAQDGFKADLFLSANPEDVRTAIDNGMAAATMLPKEHTMDEYDDGIVRIAFDGDSVLFSSEADDYYREKGLHAFRENELKNADIPLGDGPFKEFLKIIHELQKEYPVGSCPIRVALVTARGMPSHGRVITTLRHWGIRIDEAIFAGGAPKGPLLKCFRADIFFDDTKKNIDSAISCDVPSGHVPFGSGHGIVQEVISDADKKAA